MAHTVAQRLAIVETKVGAIAEQQHTMAQDLIIVRDYVVAEQAKKAVFNKIFVVVGGLITAAAGLVKVFGAHRPA